MGRKPICNVEKKIMEEVLRADFKYGIYSLSTKEIASHLKISEPVIFSHFKTKQNLLDRSFEYALAKINLASAIPEPGSVIVPDAEERFLTFFQFALQEPKALVYANNYAHSPYYHPEFAYAVEKGVVDGAVDFLNKSNGADEEDNRHTALGFLSLIVAGLSRFASGGKAISEKELRLFTRGLLYGMVGVAAKGN
jgi:AcrR family transcriptional regulator